MELRININDDMQKRLAGIASEMHVEVPELASGVLEYYLYDQENISTIRSALIEGERSGRSNYSLKNLMEKLGRK